MTGPDAALWAEWIDTPLGGMILVADSHRQNLAEFVGRRALQSELRRLSAGAGGRIGLGRTAIADMAQRQFDEYFAGQRRDFDLPLGLHGTPFQRLVWRALRDIAPGQIRSYGDLARQIGWPGSARMAR